MILVIYDPKTEEEFVIHDYNELTKTKPKIEYDSHSSLDEVGYSMTDNNAPIYLAILQHINDEKMILANAQSKSYIDHRTEKLLKERTEIWRSLSAKREELSEVNEKKVSGEKSLSFLQESLNDMTLVYEKLLSKVNSKKTELDQVNNELSVKQREFEKWIQSSILLRFLYYLYKQD